MQRPQTPEPSHSANAVRRKTVDRVGKYDLIAVLARGGMGDVYLGVLQGPVGFSKLLVIKELRRDVQEDEAHISMFLDEARLAARLNHPNIVQTIEVGADGQRRFIAMEYLEGQPLNRVLHRARKRGTPLPPPMHFRIVCDALTALEYAHSFTEFDGTPLGVVHRDVSPQNVFVTYEGHVKLIDFGVARTSVASQQTRPGSLKGKLKYMSPEQAASRFVDRRTDIFATGIMLWEGILGAGPWEGLADLDILKNLMSGRVPRLSQVRPDLDPDLTEIVDRATSPDPGDRYPTAHAMRDELEHYVAVHGLSLGRELPAFVSMLFREDRRKLLALIDAQLRILSESSPVELLSISGMRRMSIGSTESGGPQRRTVTGSLAFDGAPASVASATPPPRGRIAPAVWMIVAAIGSAVAFGAVVVRFSMQVPSVRAPASATSGLLATSRTLATPALPVLPASPPTPPAAARPPTRRPAHVSVRASPAWAELYIDGFRVGNPYLADWAPDGAIHHVNATAPGYFDQSSAVSLDRDIVIDLSLERAPTPRPPPASPPPRTPAAPPPASQATTPSQAVPDGKAGAEPDALPPRSTPRFEAKPARELDTNNPYP
ncbi:MAG TPA: serine/threonine-protein kinase [Polyangiaceae bacterium]|nr:serine/threonine-protein kinase [Polyangiaceae bacterium]